MNAAGSGDVIRRQAPSPPSLSNRTIKVTGAAEPVARRVSAGRMCFFYTFNPLGDISFPRRRRRRA